MSPIDPLPPEALYTVCDPGGFGFETTAELDDLDGVIGQNRAVEAVRFGLGIRRKGFNLFALGPEGVGKQSLLERFVREAAAHEPVPDDWCYVFNFEAPTRPRALRLPAGRARPLADDMKKLVEDLRQAIPATFESDEYRNRREVLDQQLKETHEEVFGEFQKRAAEQQVAMVRTPMGFGLAPTKDGEILSPDEFEALPEAERKERAQAIEALQEDMQALLRQVPRWEKEQREKIRELNREVSRFAVGHLIEELAKKYEDLSEVCAYLHAVENSVVENVAEFLPHEPQTPQAPQTPPNMGRGEGGGEGEGDGLRRFKVNVLVDNGDAGGGSCAGGAPVVYEDHPTQPNVIGRIEHLSRFGALITDFNMIRAGALHRANGGYLILDARKLITQPFTWDALKRTLRSDRIRIESPGEAYGLISTVTLEPEPIPLAVKVVLFGDPYLYYLLSRLDPEFSELFKVAADFDTRMDRSGDNTDLFARMLGTLARKGGLKALDRGAVARAVEHGARLADDAEKLSTHMGSIEDLLQEADYWAGQAKRETITRADVERAIEARIYRSDRVRERIHEGIARGTFVIETTGLAVGQINGLAVLQLDSFAFGKPSRISCRVRLGKGEVVDIEREVDMGGPLHSKGVLILSSFLATRYAQDRPLSLKATLAFEQSYGGVDGDSASSTELYALLSAIAEIPIRQDLAVTGSVDQTGRVQAIGGVNEKIEGFFDVCRASRTTGGLTGTQGVLIPAANVRHLMLRADVVEACREGKFHIYPVAHIDEGIEILTGIAAGEPAPDGTYPLGTVNRAVAARLAALHRKAIQAAAPPGRRGPAAPGNGNGNGQ